MRFDRLDRAVGLALAALAMVATVILLRGDQIGVRVTQIAPADGALDAPLRPVIAISFSEPMAAASLEGRIRLEPTVTGTVRWASGSVLFTPAKPLRPGSVYTLTVLAGAQGARGRPLRDDFVARFTTHAPRIVYLAPATGVADLVVAELGPEGPISARRLTSEPFGVFDYAISPDGRRIAYSANRDAAGSRDLYVIDTTGMNRVRAVACDLQHCQTPSWSYDSARILFERRNLDKAAIGLTPGPARAWLYDVAAGQATALFTDTQVMSSLPRWSTQGEVLTYYDNIQSLLTVLDLRTGDQRAIPSLLGDPPAWSPDGDSFLYADLVAGGDSRFQQVLKYGVATNTITPAMALDDDNDYGPVWAPTGDAFVFGRQSALSFSASGGGAFFGPQVWMATADGLTTRALTTDTEYSHAGMAWSPDGGWIAFVRANLRAINPAPEVWLIRPDGSGGRPIASDATLPAWIP